MDNKSDCQFLIMKATIDSIRQDCDKKINKQDCKLDKLTAMVENFMDHIKISNYSPDKMDLPKAQDPTMTVPDNHKDPPFEGGNSTKNGGMWTLKHDISSPKFYELLIKTDL